MKKFFKIFFTNSLVFAILLSFFITPFSALALSLSPPTYSAPSVLRGTSQSGTVFIGRVPDETGDLHIKVKVEGDAVSSIIVEPSFIIPDGVPSVQFPFTIDATHLANGSYSTFINFLLIPAVVAEPLANSIGVTIISGVTLILRFTVSGEQVVGYTIESLSISDSETDSHSYITFDIRNTGNVDWKPQKVDLTFTDQDDLTHLITFSISGDLFTPIVPGEMLRQTVEILRALPEGKYKVSADFFDKDVEVFTLESPLFDVFPLGFLKQSGDLLSASTKKDTFVLGEKIPLEGQFKNTGEVPATVVLMTEIYLDDKYVDVIRSEETVVNTGETSNISQLVDLKNKGEYTLISFAKYSNKKTLPINVSVKVTSGNVVLDFVNSPLGLGIVIFFIALIVIAVVLKRRKSRHQSSSVPIVPVSVVAKVEPTHIEEQIVSPGSSDVERSQ